MRLSPPCSSFEFATTDIYGSTINLRDYRGKNLMLCFFRDAACPFCNFRLYELCNNYREWQDAGLEIIAVFSSTPEEVRQYVAKHPRPFRLIADPNLDLYDQYGVEQSATALFKALMFKIPRIIKGFKTGGYPSKNPNVKIVPADFLIEPNGRVAEVWYGRDTADHIPLQKVEQFINTMNNKANLKEKIELQQLREENKKLKQFLLQLKKYQQQNKYALKESLVTSNIKSH